MSTGTLLQRPLPCVGNASVYDALFDDVPQKEQQTARVQAAALCARCPSPCPDKVTETSTTRVVVELAPGWMPDAQEGRALYTGRETWHGTAAGVPTHGCRCQRCTDAYDQHLERHARRTAGQALRTGQSYVRAEDRVDAHAREALQLARKGRTVPDIALALCVTEETALRLIDRAQQITA
ncbi:hypothetical protein [Streptomyces europaeiscabiei]|uniref:hypothetical protein n=1 Tax=Streptomyces europaeiscabiei TaxID=146819 RepID=UPI002E25EC9B|nr:hypothetical protein OG858_47600 [Streptomyces europaeiscabiei]